MSVEMYLLEGAGEGEARGSGEGRRRGRVSRRGEDRDVPKVAEPVALAEHLLLDDRHDEGERGEREEDAEGEEGGAADEWRLGALEDDDVGRLGDSVVVRLRAVREAGGGEDRRRSRARADLVIARLEEGDDVAGELTRWSSAVGGGPRHLVRLAHHLGLNRALDERVDTRE